MLRVLLQLVRPFVRSRNPVPKLSPFLGVVFSLSVCTDSVKQQKHASTGADWNFMVQKNVDALFIWVLLAKGFLWFSSRIVGRLASENSQECLRHQPCWQRDLLHHSSQWSWQPERLFCPRQLRLHGLFWGGSSSPGRRVLVWAIEQCAKPRGRGFSGGSRRCEDFFSVWAFVPRAEEGIFVILGPRNHRF